MTDNLLIALPGLELPDDFPWRVKFVAAVEEQLRLLGSSGRFLPSRFFGYYFRGGQPVAVCGRWTVTLDALPALTRLPGAVEKLSEGVCSIATSSRRADPDFILVHDRHEGACWLWRFCFGLKFVEATDAVEGRGGWHFDDAENRNLLGP
jgi:hypothetical protein